MKTTARKLKQQVTDGRSKLRVNIRKRRKAIATVVGYVVSFAALKLGLDLSDEASAGISAVITGFIVERIPNAEA